MMNEFKQYRRKQIAELRPYLEGEPMDGISVSAEDAKAGSPKAGDMIARNPKNHADRGLVAAQYFADNFEAVSTDSHKQGFWTDEYPRGTDVEVNMGPSLAPNEVDWQPATVAGKTKHTVFVMLDHGCSTIVCTPGFIRKRW
jgi:hypothetical protein